MNPAGSLMISGVTRYFRSARNSHQDFDENRNVTKEDQEYLCNYLGNKLIYKNGEINREKWEYTHDWLLKWPSPGYKQNKRDTGTRYHQGYERLARWAHPQISKDIQRSGAQNPGPALVEDQAKGFASGLDFEGVDTRSIVII